MNPSRIVISDSHDPFHNLATEYHLLNNIKENDGITLFLYRNHPCVVIGRFQCPWREINFIKKPDNVLFVRRHSGGGTVYHDLGNWNFCFIKPGTLLSEEENLIFLKKVLFRCHVDVSFNERFDLIMDNNGFKKVSGSAFRRTKKACFHHGTLLVNAHLKDLKGTLGCHEDLVIEGKGVRSTPSPVMNINDVNPDFNWAIFVKELEKECDISSDSTSGLIFSDNDKIYENEMKSWDWRWGSGPIVNVCFNKIDLCFDINKGKIQNVKTSIDEMKVLEGLRIKKNHDLFSDQDISLLKKSFFQA